MDQTDTDRFERIPLSEWERLAEALERFGRVDATDDRLTCEAGAATFTVTRNGDVASGMPLHGFETSGVEAVGVAADGAALLVETGGTEYVFRRPGRRRK